LLAGEQNLAQHIERHCPFSKVNRLIAETMPTPKSLCQLYLQLEARRLPIAAAVQK